MGWRESVEAQIAGRDDPVMRIQHPKVEGVASVWLALRMRKAGPYDWT